MSSDPPQPKGKFSPYTNALKTLSARTKTPLPSLILSFGILHEVTAIVPLIGVFYASRALGVGEAIVNTVIKDTAPSFNRNSTLTSTAESGDAQGAVSWGKEKVRGWVEEGDKWAERVGRRYGVFGYEKRKPGEVMGEMESTKPGHRIAGDVANAVVAYGVTKALLPVRIGVSMYFAPAFSRGVLDPVRRGVVGLFRKPQP
ncbi:hypothetical protein AN958_08798 [Leucoagaricus sp. SymC.cos]|nr:hypothetical protein AN958_08798 [Leucoagaricus sp. SymC.cos]